MNELVTFDNHSTLKKSNSMILGKYKSTLQENRILSLAIMRIQSDRNHSGQLSAKIYPGEIKALFPNSTNIYRDLASIAKTIQGKVAFIGNGRDFQSFAMITNCNYKDGILDIRFNDSMREHLMELNGHFTSLEISTLLSFSKNSSFRLYEVLKEVAYMLDKKSSVTIEYGVEELKFMIGIVDMDSGDIKTAYRKMGNEVDWVKLYSMLPPHLQKYDEYKSFRIRVIEPAQREINEHSDIHVEFEGIRHGKRIGAIRFTVTKNDVISRATKERMRKVKKTEEAFMNRVMDVEDKDYLYETYATKERGFTKANIDKLLAVSGYNTEALKEAFAQMDRQKNVIENPMGWLIWYLQTGAYEEKEPVIEGSTGKAKAYKKLVENAGSEETKIRIWENTVTKKEDFGEFEKEFRKMGYEIGDALMLFGYGDMIDAYLSWKKGEGIPL